MKYIAHQATQIVSGKEWLSDFRILGWPLLHIALGRDSSGKILKAKGIIAIGQYAIGVVCLSQFGIGLVCVSQFCISLFSIAQFTVAALAIAQFGLFIDGIAQFAGRLVDLL